MPQVTLSLNNKMTKFSLQFFFCLDLNCERKRQLKVDRLKTYDNLDSVAVKLSENNNCE